MGGMHGFGPVERDEDGPAPGFAPGDRVVTSNMNPPCHTRLPRYARGKRSFIHRIHGIHAFPNANAHGLGTLPQPLYSVRFEAAELWGTAAERPGGVYLGGNCAGGYSALHHLRR